MWIAYDIWTHKKENYLNGIFNLNENCMINLEHDFNILYIANNNVRLEIHLPDAKKLILLLNGFRRLLLDPDCRRWHNKDIGTLTVLRKENKIYHPPYESLNDETLTSRKNNVDYSEHVVQRGYNWDEPW